MAVAAGVKKFVYVSMQGADGDAIADLAITKAHERVVAELKDSPLDYRIVRPCGYFSDMGALLSMAKRGRALLVGDGTNRMSPTMVATWVACASTSPRATTSKWRPGDLR